MHVVMATDAIHQPLTGIGRYAFELSRELACIPEIERIEYFSHGFWNDWPSICRMAGDEASHLPLLRSVGFERKRTVRNLLAGNAATLRLFESLSPHFFKFRLRHRSNAIFHSPNYFLPPHSGPMVATIHDLSHEVYPNFHPRNRVDFMKRALPKSLERADFLITASESVKREVIRSFGWSEERIATTLLGVRDIYHPRPSGDVIGAISKYGLNEGGYTLFVGTLEPRKNLIGLIDAYSRLPQALRINFPLILVGAIGWNVEPIIEKLVRGASDGWLKYLEFLPQQDLPFLYCGARLFAYPSFYEGFGLPPLEAMASGVPVVTSNLSSMPEVANGAALLVEPNDTEAISTGLINGLLDDSWRAMAVEAGLARSFELSWQTCAHQTVGVYRKINAFFK